MHTRTHLHDRLIAACSTGIALCVCLMLLMIISLTDRTSERVSASLTDQAVHSSR